MNAQHSSETGEWYTPPKYVEAVRRTHQGVIDLDPCSNVKANSIVKARGFFTADDDSLGVSWSAYNYTAFVNPPGTCSKDENDHYSVCGNEKKCSCGLPKRFLFKSIEQADLGLHVIYLAYSVNQLRHLTNLLKGSTISVSVAIPPDRIAYISPETMQPVKGNACDSAFFCLSRFSCHHDRFRESFLDLGCETYKRV